MLSISTVACFHFLISRNDYTTAQCDLSRRFILLWLQASIWKDDPSDRYKRFLTGESDLNSSFPFIHTDETHTCYMMDVLKNLSYLITGQIE